MAGTIRVLQANLHHAKGASDTFCNRFAQQQLTLGLIQEPWVSGGIIRGLHLKSCKLIYDRREKVPRTAIFVSANINVLPIPEFITKDLVAVILEIPTGRGVQETVCASAYFPGDSVCVPPVVVQDLVDYCNRKNKQFVIGCDANAHHIIWGSSDTNGRGESLLNYLMSSHINILNKGSNPTFINSIRQEVLDLTLSSQFISNFVANWHVSNEASLSDHMHIRFDIPGVIIQAAERRIPCFTNWKTYRDTLFIKADMLPTSLSSISDLETAAYLLNDVLLSSYGSSCVARNDVVKRKVPWWNEQLAKLRKRVRKLFNRAKHSNEWNNYRQALTNYNNELRRSKRLTWRTNCGNIEDIPTAARLHKVLAKEQSNEIGLLLKSDGSYTSGRKESLETLLQVHFPGCTVCDTNTITNPIFGTPIGAKVGWVNSLSGKLFTPEKVKWAINSFQPFKAPGGDGIFPALLQRGLDLITPALVALFRTSFNLGYIPQAWCQVNVVFIPKLGNRPSELPKSYRPISLTSFVLKTMERLVDLHIRDWLTVTRPLNPNQFAYRKGKSTEGALHQLVTTVEAAFRSKEVALCAFLDIEGAFDNTGYDSIAKAIRRRGIDDPTNHWISSMLVSRKITSKLGNESVTITAIRGCPQGGVLSPLLWSLVIDELLDKLHLLGYNAIGYADDLVIIVSGGNECTLSASMQQALLVISNWCTKEGLSINPSKTVLVPFTKRRRLNLGSVSLNDITIGYSNEVKYLGVVLDKKLNWNSHIKSTTERAVRAMWACRRMFGRTWGLSSKMIYWMYIMIVRPIITYGAIVWWPKVQQKSIMNKLTSLQRLACLGITGAMRSCPTAAMEALIGLTPLHIYIKKSAATCAARLQLVNQYEHDDHMGHLDILNELTDLDMFFRVPDVMPKELCFGRSFGVTVPDRTDWDTGGPSLEPTSLVWFTDGSKMDSGVGIGVFGPNHKISKSLGTHPSVFLAEIHAIETCASTILTKGLKGASIHILSDSQAALKALASNCMDSKSVKSCYKLLQSLSCNNKVRLWWIPGHKGITGNEIADELARAGSSTTLIGPEPFCGIPWASAAYAISKWEKIQCLTYWNCIPGLRQAKSLIRPFHHKDLAVNFSKENIRKLVSFLSGHCNLRYHLNKMNLSTETECRLCLEEIETAEHILCECVALCSLRWIHFEERYLTPEKCKLASPSSILAFIRKVEKLLD